MQLFSKMNDLPPLPELQDGAIISGTEVLLRKLYEKVQEQEERIYKLENEVYMLQNYVYDYDED